jgi:hypothetical protein
MGMLCSMINVSGYQSTASVLWNSDRFHVLYKVSTDRNNIYGICHLHGVDVKDGGRKLIWLRDYGSLLCFAFCLEGLLFLRAKRRFRGAMSRFGLTSGRNGWRTCFSHDYFLILGPFCDVIFLRQNVDERNGIFRNIEKICKLKFDRWSSVKIHEIRTATTVSLPRYLTCKTSS